jgi:hypothetical protein
VKELKPAEQQKEMTVEVKHLASSIRNITSSFNGDVTELLQQRLCLLREIHVNELYQVLLINFVFQSDDRVHEASNFNLKEQFELDVLRQHVVDLDKVSLTCEKAKRDMLQKLHEDKMLDKSFRKRLQQANGGVIDQEILNLLYQMFRQRNLKTHGHRSTGTKPNISKKKKFTGNNGVRSRHSELGRQSYTNSSSFTSKSIDTTNNNRSSYQNNGYSVKMNIELAIEEAKEEQLDDPFYATKNQNVNCLMYEEIGKDGIPEGFAVAENVWTSMQQLRREKIQKEADVEKSKTVVKHTKCLLESVEQSQTKAVKTIKDIRSEVEKLQHELDTELPHLILLIQQGKDENKASPLSSTYENAIFINSSQIEEINRKIREYSEYKHTLVSKTRKLQQAINKLKWKQELLLMEKNHENEVYVDFQFMHLSNELKMLLHGEDFIDKAPNIGDQPLRHKGSFESKLNKCLSDRRALLKTMKDRQNENCQLRIQLESLRLTIQEREKRHKVCNFSCVCCSHDSDAF